MSTVVISRPPSFSLCCSQPLSSRVLKENLIVRGWLFFLQLTRLEFTVENGWVETESLACAWCSMEPNSCLPQQPEDTGVIWGHGAQRWKVISQSNRVHKFQENWNLNSGLFANRVHLCWLLSGIYWWGKSVRGLSLGVCVETLVSGRPGTSSREFFQGSSSIHLSIQ